MSLDPGHAPAINDPPEHPWAVLRQSPEPLDVEQVLSTQHSTFEGPGQYPDTEKPFVVQSDVDMHKPLPSGVEQVLSTQH